MNRQKIYFLINSLGAGGAERVVSNLATNFSESCDVTIITLKDEKFFYLPDTVRYLPLSRVKNNLLMAALFPWFCFRLRRLLRDFDSGVSFLELSNFLHILSRKDAIISFRIHIDFFRGMVGFVYRRLIKALYPRAGKIIVNSEENRHDLAEYLQMPVDKIFTIYNPVSIQDVRQKMREPVEDWILKKIQNKKVFITTGRLEWQKHHMLILQTFYTIYHSGEHDFIWLIIGDGSEFGKLQKKITEYGLQDNVFLLKKQQNVFKYLGVSNYFLYASESEGFPNVLIEAMACDLPIISSDFKSGAKECVFGKYDKSLKIEDYPSFGPNGVLLHLNDYEREFIEIYKNLFRLKQQLIGFDKFINDDIFAFINL